MTFPNITPRLAKIARALLARPHDKTPLEGVSREDRSTLVQILTISGCAPNYSTDYFGPDLWKRKDARQVSGVHKTRVRYAR